MKTRGGLQNRNQIKTATGASWLTVPVRASLSKTIAETEIADPRWRERHVRTIEMNYARAPYLGRFMEQFRPLLERDWTCSRSSTSPSRSGCSTR